MAEHDFVEGDTDVAMQRSSLGKEAGVFDGREEEVSLFFEAIDLGLVVLPDVLDLDEEGLTLLGRQFDLTGSPETVFFGIELDFQPGTGLDNLFFGQFFGEENFDGDGLADRPAGVADDGAENDTTFFQPDAPDRFAGIAGQERQVGIDEGQEAKNLVFGFVFGIGDGGVKNRIGLG